VEVQGAMVETEMWDDKHHPQEMKETTETFVEMMEG
jgi:hypothetical protein